MRAPRLPQISQTAVQQPHGHQCPRQQQQPPRFERRGLQQPICPNEYPLAYLPKPRSFVRLSTASPSNSLQPAVTCCSHEQVRGQPETAPHILSTFRRNRQASAPSGGCAPRRARCVRGRDCRMQATAMWSSPCSGVRFHLLPMSRGGWRTTARCLHAAAAAKF
jgi:hypothetical protein